MGWGSYREEEFCFPKKVVRMLYRMLPRSDGGLAQEADGFSPQSAQREGNAGTTGLQVRGAV